MVSYLYVIFLAVSFGYWRNLWNWRRGADQAFTGCFRGTQRIHHQLSVRLHSALDVLLLCGKGNAKR